MVEAYQEFAHSKHLDQQDEGAQSQVKPDFQSEP